MDELTFRRQAYSDPNNTSAQFLQAMAQSPARAAFVKELKQLDGKIDDALNIDVPDDLAEKLLLRQQLQHHNRSRKYFAAVIATAASIAFVAGISLSMLRTVPVSLGQHALAHVHHETNTWGIDENIDFQDVNLKLASLNSLNNAHFTKQPGQVFYSTYCDFQGVRSLHLVMEGKYGKVTLFIVPSEKRMVLDKAFEDNEYKGIGFQQGNAYMLLVGEEKSDLDYLKQELKQSFI